MASYVITGASRGLGYEYSRKLSSDPLNKVFSVVRNKAATEARLAKDGIKNVTVLQADVTDHVALQAAAESVSKATGGTLDYLIHNAAYVAQWSSFKNLSEYEADPKPLEDEIQQTFEANTLGTYRTIFAFLPLIRKGNTKKVLFISSGMADIDLIKDFYVGDAAPYAISKAAANIVIAKFHAAYGKEGVLFISVSPGVVATSDTPPTAEELDGGKALMQQLAEYAPHFKGPITPAESVERTLKIIRESSVANGDGGNFVSHFGNKQWL